MNKFIYKIYSNFNYGIQNYEKNFKSKHWKFVNKKKKNLFKIKNLKNFRNNSLSEGLDDQFYSNKQTKIHFKELIKNCGKKFIINNLNKYNVGNVKYNFRYFGKIVDKNEIFHVKYLYDVQNKIKLKKKDWICEIGAGYGSFSSKLLKKFKCKLIIIDLPEANFISSYYLNYLFPKKKILLSEDIKNNKITREQIKKNDIFILFPWDNFPNIKVKLFVNTRSMMEMNYKTIKDYFCLIQKKNNKKWLFF